MFKWTWTYYVNWQECRTPANQTSDVYYEHAQQYMYMDTIRSLNPLLRMRRSNYITKSRTVNSLLYTVCNGYFIFCPLLHVVPWGCYSGAGIISSQWSSYLRIWNYIMTSQQIPCGMHIGFPIASFPGPPLARKKRKWEGGLGTRLGFPLVLHQLKGQGSIPKTFFLHWYVIFLYISMQHLSDQWTSGLEWVWCAGVGLTLLFFLKTLQCMCEIYCLQPKVVGESGWR